MFCKTNYEMIIVIRFVFCIKALFLNTLDQCYIKTRYKLELLKPIHIIFFSLLKKSNVLISRGIRNTYN